MEITIDNLRFDTLGDAKLYVKRIHNKYKENDIVSDEDKEFLIKCLEFRGDRGDNKIGCGVENIYLRRTKYNNLCFCIKRYDGTTTDFSYTKIFQRVSNSKKNIIEYIYFSESCRNAIRDDILKILYEYGGNNMVVHHVIPFSSIVKNFIGEYNIDINSIEYCGFDDNQTGKYFKDDNMSLLFRQYHDDNAILKVVTKDEHKNIHFTNKK